MGRKQHYMTEQERFKLEGYLQAGRAVSWIAGQMDFTRQTIYNEIRRGTEPGAKPESYSARKGQSVQEERGENKGCPQKLGGENKLMEYLERKMLGIQEDGSIDRRQRYSPAAALAAAEADGYEVNISIGTLYNYIDRGRFPTLRNEDLWEKTSRRPKRKIKKPKVAHENLPNIEKRPPEINERSEVGHWEMDLIVGCAGTRPCLLTLTERVTREEIIIKIPNKKAATIRKAFNRLEKETPNFKEKFKSITTDNGSEFLEYEKLKKSVTQTGDRFQVYYCHSYAAWEKGTNENHNKMIRRWFPKGTDFTKVTRAEVRECQKWMNHYPRKILSWKSPVQIAMERGPRPAKALRRGPRSISFLLVSPPSPGWFFYTIHVYLLTVLLKLQDFLFGHHLTLFHGVFEITNTGQSVIGFVILVRNEPTGTGKRCYQLRACGILQFPSVIFCKTLEPPELITISDITRHLPEKGVNVAEPLSGIVETDVIMAASQNGIQKQRVNVGFEVPAIHLYAELVTEDKRYRQGIVFIVIGLFAFCIQDYLFQRHKILIGNGQGNIGNYLDALSNNLLAARTPDFLAVIVAVSSHNTVNRRKGLAFSKEAGVGHQLPSAAEIILSIAEIAEQIQDAINSQGDRVRRGTPERRKEQEADKHSYDNYGNHKPLLLPLPKIHKNFSQLANHAKDSRHQSDTNHHLQEIGDQFRQRFRRNHIKASYLKKFSYHRSHEKPPFSIRIQGLMMASQRTSRSKRPSKTV